MTQTNLHKKLIGPCNIFFFSFKSLAFEIFNFIQLGFSILDFLFSSLIGLSNLATFNLVLEF
jgi:hypothetical protein